MNQTTQAERQHRISVFKKLSKKSILTIVIYGVAILYFFPVLYMFLTAFKTEFQAATPSLTFTPTLETMRRVLGDRNMLGFLRNSLFQVVTGTIFCLLLGRQPI